MTGRFRVLALLLTAAVLQATLFDEIRISGVAVEYLLLVSVLAGHHGGPERGAMVGFFAGLLHDSLSGSPLGLHALVFAPVAAVVGHLSVRIAEGARGLAFLGLFTSVVAGVLGAAVAGALFGLTSVDEASLLGTAAIAGLLALLLAGPTSRIVGWAVTGGLPVDVDVRGAGASKSRGIRGSGSP